MFAPTLSTAPPMSEQKPRALIVLGEAETQALVERLLQNDGYEVIAVADTDEVLRLAAEFEPDIILLDADLPDNAGLEACGEFRASDLQHQTPIVLAGTSLDEDTIARALFAGADDFVVPERTLELRARIRVQLRNKRYRDALARVRSERDSLKRDLRFDALTGTLNRRSLDAAIRTHFDSRERFAILFVDIDHFKSVNDRFGHDVGDTVLKATAEMLKQGIRPGDAVGRYGGEEFVLLISGAGPESARLVAERHRRTVEALDFHGLGPTRVTISMGVAVLEPDQCDASSDDLIRRADLALYRAKSEGRNRVCMSPPLVAPVPASDASVPGPTSGRRAVPIPSLPTADTARMRT